MTSTAPEISPFGDSALLVSFEERIDPLINRKIVTLAERIEAARRTGTAWARPVAAYASLLAAYDPLVLDRESAEAKLRGLLAELPLDQDSADELPVLELPVRYGGEGGPDLADVARATGRSQAEVIALHSGQLYRAYFLGFAPGFAYLASLPNALRLPRRSTPRQRVPAGSVAIAGEQTAVYPLATPGGWHLLGQCPLALWDVNREPPALIRPGQQVRFVAQDG